jgi:hypothetical protein
VAEDAVSRSGEAASSAGEVGFEVVDRSEDGARLAVGRPLASLSWPLATGLVVGGVVAVTVVGLLVGWGIGELFGRLPRRGAVVLHQLWASVALVGVAIVAWVGGRTSWWRVLVLAVLLFVAWMLDALVRLGFVFGLSLGLSPWVDFVWWSVLAVAGVGVGMRWCGADLTRVALVGVGVVVAVSAGYIGASDLVPESGFEDPSYAEVGWVEEDVAWVALAGAIFQSGPLVYPVALWGLRTRRAADGSGWLSFYGGASLLGSGIVFAGMVAMWGFVTVLGVL